MGSNPIGGATLLFLSVEVQLAARILKVFKNLKFKGISMEITLAAKLMNENTKVLTKLLYENNLTRVVLSYSGMGDSGNGIDVDEVEGNSVNLRKSVENVVLKYENRYRYDPEKVKTSTPNTVKEALEQYADAFTDMYQAGYEINEGGGGTIVFDREDEEDENPDSNYGYKVHVSSYINIVTEEYTDFNF